MGCDYCNANPRVAYGRSAVNCRDFLNLGGRHAQHGTAREIVDYILQAIKAKICFSLPDGFQDFSARNVTEVSFDEAVRRLPDDFISHYYQPSMASTRKNALPTVGDQFYEKRGSTHFLAELSQ
ncbi:MAG: hypothetical protein EG825_09725 [Rhodocyclaceae bacterium]|nr:hypothetical protein [Rhodocyclaceae bacterium]